MQKDIAGGINNAQKKCIEKNILRDNPWQLRQKTKQIYSKEELQKAYEDQKKTSGTSHY